MRVLHVGLGDFGFLWFKALADRQDVSLVGIADIDETTFRKVRDHAPDKAFRFYTDAAAAMDEQQPDFVVNATPPAAHQAINMEACKLNIPVLCEKPISDNYDDACRLLRCAQNGWKIVIAQNYRYLDENRFVKKFLDQNPIGNMTGIDIAFRRNHHVGGNNYHNGLSHPLLLDVTIHHLDLLRYFGGKEVKTVLAEFFTPPQSWYRGYSNAVIGLTMEDGVDVRYCGSLDSPGSETSWNAEWAFTGEKGGLQYRGNKLYLNTGGRTVTVPVRDRVNHDKDLMLDDFIVYLRTGKLPPTHIFDNIKTFRIAHGAMQSFETGKEVDLAY